eukprot:SAG31_NODE_159_length_21911_cov_12.220750_14_plen_128_part_00
MSAFGGSDASVDLDQNGSVDVNDVLETLSAFGTECTNIAPAPPPPPPPPPATCVLGDDCGGQEWNDCGTACPPVCGEALPAFCIMMCNAGYQCSGSTEWFDPEVGQCVAESDCTTEFELPPGVSMGR